MIFPKDPTELYKLKVPGAALDIGTGEGYNLRKMLEFIGNKLIIGIDVNLNKLKKVNSSLKNPNLELVQANAEYLPFKDNVFGIVASSYTFHHIDNKKKAVEEIWRAMKELGFAVIFDWTPSSRSSPHSPDELKVSMFDTLSAFKRTFFRFRYMVEEERYAIFVEKEEAF